MLLIITAIVLTRWNRFLSQLLPLSSLVTNAASAQYDLTR